jgi:glycerol uptake facilitator-like aquaporin
MKRTLARRLLAEYLGSAFLAAVVIGSGIAARQLSPDDTGLALLENAAATATGLFAIILMFGPVSGGHFNPVVSLVDAHFGGMSWRDALAYIPAQVAGCITGAITANAMFALTAISISTHHRASGPHLFAEVIATLGLLLVVFSLARTGRATSAPAAVGAYIGASGRHRRRGGRRRLAARRRARDHPQSRGSASIGWLISDCLSRRSSRRSPCG